MEPTRDRGHGVDPLLLPGCAAARGVGLRAPIVNGIDKSFITRAITEFNAIDMIPKSCKDCLANGHATGILEWALRFDSKLKVELHTHARDHVIGEFFMGTTADQFEDAVVAETTRLLSEIPRPRFPLRDPEREAHARDGRRQLAEGCRGRCSALPEARGVGFVGPDVNSEEGACRKVRGRRHRGR